MLGYAKIVQVCRLAKADGLRFAWIDTLCIDKSSSAELSEAINSMYEYYKQAKHCYAYLDDYPMTKSMSPGDGCVHYSGDPQLPRDMSPTTTEADVCKDCFRRCHWLSRGWTLQEMLAPRTVKFYDRDWNYIGSVGRMPTSLETDHQQEHLEDVISGITHIPLDYIRRQKAVTSASVAQRFSWASERQTSKEEDMAYCLLGLFDVHMPLLYGEGSKKAFMRLQEEIMKRSDDQSMFAWGLNHVDGRLGWDHSQILRDKGQEHDFEKEGKGRFRQGPLLSPSPAYFANSGGIIPTQKSTINPGEPHYMTNRGLRIDTFFLENEVTQLTRKSQSIDGVYDLAYVTLGCVEADNPYCPLVMCVTHLEGNIYARALDPEIIAASVPRPVLRDAVPQTIYYMQQPQSYATDAPGARPIESTCLLRRLPPEFGACVDWYPSGCWDRVRGILSASVGPAWSALIFPLTDKKNHHIALMINFQPLYWKCCLELVSSKPPRLAESMALAYGNKEPRFLLLQRRGTPHRVYLAGRAYSVRMAEDLIVGSVFGVEIKEIYDKKASQK